MKVDKLTGWLRRLFPRQEPYAFTVDYERQRLRDGYQRQHRLDIAFFIHNLPRLVWLCRLLGHRPVVDGCRPTRTGSYVSQPYLWVRCGRCGERGHPQGSLDPNVWQIGQDYTGDWDMRPRKVKDRVAAAWKRGDEARPLLEPPGPIGHDMTGHVGGHLVIGGGHPGWDIEVKIGNRFSEQTLAAHLRLGRLGALYVHTEGFGMWLVALLNPWAETSKLVGMHLGDGRGGWKLWANRWHGYEDNIRQPWWKHTDIDLRVVDRLLGPKRYSYTDVDLNDGDPVVRIVRMPERDYLVRLKLQRCTFGRKHQLRKRKQTWCVDWEALGAGIPARHDDGWKGPIMGSGVDVSHQSVCQGTWPSEATARIALEMTKMRTRYGWDPIAALPLISVREPV